MLRLFCLALFLPAFLCTLHDYEKEFEEAQAKFGGVAKRTPHDYVMDYMHALEKYGGEGLVKRDAADIKAHINSFIKYAKEVEKINEDSSIPFTAEVSDICPFVFNKTQDIRILAVFSQLNLLEIFST